MIRLAVALACLLLLSGCIAKAGPFVIGIGQVESCEGTYTYDAERGQWRCDGQYVAGAAISETAGRAVGVVGDAAMRVGGALGGATPP